MLLNIAVGAAICVVWVIEALILRAYSRRHPVNQPTDVAAVIEGHTKRPTLRSYASLPVRFDLTRRI